MQIQKLSFVQHEIVRALFHDNDTNLAAAYAVIEGLIPGQIWVDNQSNPKVCLILGEDPYCIIAGRLDEEVFQQFLTLLKRKKNVRLQCGLSAYTGKLNFSEFGFSQILRREYRYKTITADIPYYENTSQYLLKAIVDEKTFALCEWRDLMLEIYGDVQTYLKNALGYMLFDTNQQRVVSEAHGICSKRYLEIATITNESYRGQKLSTFLCNHLIHIAINRGFIPVYACNEVNMASRRVAEHQGMDDITQYVFYTLEQ